MRTIGTTEMGHPAGSLLDALAAVTAALDAQSESWMLIGGLAVVAAGVSRTTRDIDIALEGGTISAGELVEHLGQWQLDPRIPDAVDFAEVNGVLLLEHAPSGTPVDLSLAFIPFEVEAIESARRVTFGATSRDPTRVPVASPSALVVYKSIAWRARDREDVAELLRLHGAGMDVPRLRAVMQELFEAMEEPERLADFDALVAQLLPPSSS